jgi:chromosomal replication initiator protein
MIYEFASRPYMPWLAGPLVTFKPRMTVKRIQEVAAAYYGIPLMEMTSSRRAAHIAQPRQVAMYLARELTPLSLPSIGRFFGDRDHTTILHGIRAVERRAGEQTRLASDLDNLRSELAA